MTSPTVTFDRDEMKLHLTGIGTGVTLGNLFELHVLDEAQVEFPTSWSALQTSVALQVLQTNLRLRGTTDLRQTLEAGLTYSRAEGPSAEVSATTELVEHLMARPTAQIDALVTVRLSGEVTEHGFSGDYAASIGLRVRF